jgi:tetratricopeptide (TPR) repeat protein
MEANSPMSSNPSNTTNVSHAWRHQREHQPQLAIPEYEKILQQDPDNIDALYGYGLAQRDSGNTQGAIASFQHCLELVDAAALARRPAITGEEEHRVANTPDDDRYMMLSRMLKQRLNEIKAGK